MKVGRLARGTRQEQIKQFWEGVDRTSTCWNWTRGTQPSGYGKMRFGGAVVSVHRLSFELANGPIPMGFYVCHHCDNPRCVRPDHLYLGNAWTNNHDTLERGKRPTRYRKSERQRVKEAKRPSAA